MESRQRHLMLLSFTILSIHHVVFCQSTQCSGCAYPNCNPNIVTSKCCEPGQFTFTMNVPCKEESCCNSFNECQCSSSVPLSCSESCTSCPSVQAPCSQCSCSFPVSPPNLCQCTQQPMTKLFLLLNQPCVSPSPPCCPTCSSFNIPASCLPTISNFCTQRSLPSVLLPPQVPLPQPLCLQTSFPLLNIGVVQPDSTIAQCNSADFENLINDCWNEIPSVSNFSPVGSCVSTVCQSQVPVLQLRSQQADCGSTSYPQIIIQKSTSKLRKLLPILLIAMLSGNDNNYDGCSGGGGGGTVIPIPYPIPIPCSTYIN